MASCDGNCIGECECVKGDWGITVSLNLNIRTGFFGALLSLIATARLPGSAHANVAARQEEE